MSDAAAKSISGGKLFAIFLAIGALICVLLVYLYEVQLVKLNEERDAALQAEYAAFDAMYPVEEEVVDTAAEGEVVADEAVTEEAAPAE